MNLRLALHEHIDRVVQVADCTEGILLDYKLYVHSYSTFIFASDPRTFINAELEKTSSVNQNGITEGKSHGHLIYDSMTLMILVPSSTLIGT